MKSVSINPDAACTPTAARPFRVEESYCTLFESPILAGIGSNIVPAFIRGFVDNFDAGLRPARLVNIFPFTYLFELPGAVA